MKTKISWIVFILSLVTIIPVKIYSSINSLNWERTPMFAIIVAILLLMCGVPLYMAKDLPELPQVRKSFLLGIISCLTAVAFLWGAVACVTDIEAYDRHPLILSILCLLSAVTFIFMSISFFTCKNMFKNGQILIFFPVLWSGMLMILFLSLSDNNIDPYNVLLKACMLMFLLYQSQIFVTSTDRNTTRRIFMFGMPTILSLIMYNVPLVVSLVKNNSLSFYSTTVATCGIETLICLYILCLLFECQSQINSKKS